jgi:site-specific DNA-methyltransferase (adenine-specific)
MSTTKRKTLFGEEVEPKPTVRSKKTLRPTYTLEDPEARVYVGDCREVLARLPEAKRGAFDLVFADPPFNWGRAYDEWDDAMTREAYLSFTYEWLRLCHGALTPTGSMWVNIPDDTAAEIVVYLKNELKMQMVNWCIWHYRFGQNRNGSFINSKVHVLYFTKDPFKRTWNPEPVLEPSDRATTYFDPRTMSKKDGMPAGMRVPMDVWYGQYWGRIQGNNKERRGYHDNQLPEVYLERVILSSSNEGDLVLDPFLGSGTTGVVAHALGRRFVGIEYSKENAKSSYERMKAGPIRVGLAANQSTAIFKPRKIGKKTKERLRTQG